MARKTLTVTINDDNRDKGKAYFITEMPAAQGEMWAAKAFLGLARSNVNVEGIENMGMAGIAMMGFKAMSGMSIADLAPLMEEMFACVQIMPDAARPDVVRKIVADSDIEEISTRIKLRIEIFKLHADFFLNAVT